MLCRSVRWFEIGGRSCLQGPYLEQPIPTERPQGPQGQSLQASSWPYEPCSTVGPWEKRPFKICVWRVTGQTKKELSFSTKFTTQASSFSACTSPGTGLGPCEFSPQASASPKAINQGLITLNKAIHHCLTYQCRNRGATCTKEGGGALMPEMALQSGACWAEGSAGT